jgi:hypothetical protein
MAVAHFEELIEVTFRDDKTIETDDHPAMRRLTGARQELS